MNRKKERGSGYKSNKIGKEKRKLEKDNGKK